MPKTANVKISDFVWFFPEILMSDFNDQEIEKMRPCLARTLAKHYQDICYRNSTRQHNDLSSEMYLLFFFSSSVEQEA